MIFMLLTAIFYSLALSMVVGLVISYGIAYKMSKSKSILSIFLFLTAVLALNFAVVLDYWSRVIHGGEWKMPFNWFRAFFMFITSAYFLYTTWETKEIKKK